MLQKTICNSTSFSTKPNAEKRSISFSVLFLLFSMFCCCILCSKLSLIFIDDVMYADFTQHGLKYFIEQNIWHYQNYNGRVFVHLCLQFCLLFKEYLYIMLMPIFIATIFYNFSKILLPDIKTEKRIWISGFGLLAFLGIGINFIESTLMWMSGGFNYIFPLFFISFVLLRLTRCDNKFNVLTAILVFLSGATTEQYGIMTIGYIVLETFFYFKNNKKINKTNLAYLLIAIIGLITIIISGGTAGHLEEASTKFTESGVLTMFFSRFLMNCKVSFGSMGNYYIAFILFLLIGVMGLIKKDKYNKLCLLGIPFAIVSLILNTLKMETDNNILIFIGYIVLIVALLKSSKTIKYGEILLLGLGTLFMMSFVHSGGQRTALPFVFTNLILTTMMLYDIATTIKIKSLKTIIVSSFVFIYFISFIPVVQGYSYGAVFCNDVKNQLELVQSTNTLTIDLDQTMASGHKYRYVTPFDAMRECNMYWYKQYYNISDDVKILYTSNQMDVSNATINGKSSYFPIINKDDKIYVSSQLFKNTNTTEILSSQGILKNEDYEHCIVDGKIKQIDVKTTKTLSEIAVDTYTLNQYGYTSDFVELEAFAKYFNLSYEYDESNNTYNFATAN